MKSKILWQCTALFLLSFIFPACKKEIKQMGTTQPTQADGSANSLDVTCIPNGIQFFKTEALSLARSNPLGIGLSNKVLFVEGSKRIPGPSGPFFVPCGRVDIYNTTSDSWTHKILREEVINNSVQGKTGQALAAAGTKIGVAGGAFEIDGTRSDRVDIYDVNSDSWTVSHMSVRRVEAAGVGYGNLLYFAGGFGNNNKEHKSIDVYNTLNGSWSQLSLSISRYGLAAAATNNKILFAGGQSGVQVTDRVDIYDVPTGTWTISAVSQPRTRMVAAALGNLIIFGGGFNLLSDGNPGQFFDIVDIYNTSTGQWSVTHVSNAPGWYQSAVQGTKMFFINTGSTSEPVVVDMYDICSNSWGTLSLTDGRINLGVGAAGSKVLFGGGFLPSPDNVVKTVDIFNLGPLIAQ
jgi:hypothetical protein